MFFFIILAPGGTRLLDWTHMCDRARRRTDARLFVSNEYLSCRFGCIIEPTGFNILNKHAHACSFVQDADATTAWPHTVFK